MPSGAEPFPVRDEWRRQVLGPAFGYAGLVAADLDADGDREVAGTVRGFWYVLAHQPDGGYEQAWASDPYPEQIDSLIVAQADTDPALEVVVGNRRYIDVHDGATHARQSRLDVQANNVYGLNVADVDGDGALEAIFFDMLGHSLRVHDLATGALEDLSYWPDYINAVAVGNVDKDPGLEIVIAGWGYGSVLDGVTGAVEWSYPQSFGGPLTLADLDGDGVSEIVAANSIGGGIAVFDAVRQMPIGTIPPTAQPLGVLHVVDVEGDGPVDIVAGEEYSFGGSIYVFNGQTLALKWSMSAIEDGVAGLAVANLDDDPANEMIWSAGVSTTRQDHTHVLDLQSNTLEWTSLEWAGPVRALAYGDVDADGEPELLYGASRTEDLQSRWFVHDARTKALEQVSAPLPPFGGGDVVRLRHANVDADPQHEIFVFARGEHDSSVVCRDGITQLEQWRLDGGPGMYLAGMELGDVDGQPGLEVVVTVIDSSSSPADQRVRAYDAATGALKWTSGVLYPIGPGGELLRIGNVDADPRTEIVVAGLGGSLFTVDGVTHGVLAIQSQDLSALELADLDADGVDEMLIGTRDGRIGTISISGNVTPIATYPGRIDGLQLADADGDGVLDLVFCVANEVVVRSGASGADLWRSGPLPPPGPFNFDAGVGKLDSLLVADVDEDGKLEIVVNLGGFGLRVFEIPTRNDLSLSVVDSPDPTLVGGPLTYAWRVRNGGTAAAEDVRLQVALPSASFVSSTPGPPACTTAGAVLSCALDPVPGGAEAEVQVVVAPRAEGPLSSTGAVTATVWDPFPADNAASAATTVTATVQADLSVAIDDGRVLVGPGQTLDYRIDVANQGPWAVGSVFVNATLPPGLVNPVFTPSAGAYDPATGAWTGLSLGTGQGVSMQMAATVAATGTIVNTTRVSPPAGTTDLVPANDEARDTDLSVLGRGELAHGTSALVPVDAQGDRHFAIRQAPWSSYEVVIDAVSGDLAGVASPIRLQRLAGDLSVVADSTPVGNGPARSLRWENASSAVVEDQVIRVRSAGCTTDCGADDVFRVRAYDTTCDVARFNNGGGQASVVIVQNASSGPVNGAIRFWSAAGTLLASQPFTNVPPRGVHTLITPTVPALAGAAGSVTVTSDAPYGTLAGKVVSVEPATGFAFDTPLRARPR